MYQYRSIVKMIVRPTVTTQTQTNPPPPPPPISILQKLLMRERIHIQTWNLVCDTTVTTQTQTNPPQTHINFAKTPYGCVIYWDKIMLNHEERWKRKNFEKFSILIVKSSFFDEKTYEKLTFSLFFSDWHKIMLNYAER